MSFTLLISDSAYLDIADAGEYYDLQRPGLSNEFESCVKEGYKDIVLAPYAYQIKYKGIRVKYIKRFPFGIHYLVEDDVIYVEAVFHTRRNPKRWFDRLGENDI